MSLDSEDMSDAGPLRSGCCVDPIHYGEEQMITYS
jgi:hypothetical protein